MIRQWFDRSSETCFITLIHSLTLQRIYAFFYCCWFIPTTSIYKSTVDRQLVSFCANINRWEWITWDCFKSAFYFFVPHLILFLCFLLIECFCFHQFYFLSILFERNHILIYLFIYSGRGRINYSYHPHSPIMLWITFFIIYAVHIQSECVK